MLPRCSRTTDNMDTGVAAYMRLPSSFNCFSAGLTSSSLFVYLSRYCPTATTPRSSDHSTNSDATSMSYAVTAPLPVSTRMMSSDDYEKSDSRSASLPPESPAVGPSGPRYVNRSIGSRLSSVSICNMFSITSMSTSAY